MFSWLLNLFKNNAVSTAEGAVESAVKGGIMAWVSQYVLYIAGLVLVVLLGLAGVQTVRVKILKSGNAALTAQMQVRDAVIEQYMQTTKAFKDKVDVVNQQVVAATQRHSEEVATLRAEKFPQAVYGTCRDILEGSVQERPGAIEGSTTLPPEEKEAPSQSSEASGVSPQPRIILNCQELSDFAVGRVPEVLGGGYQ